MRPRRGHSVLCCVASNGKTSCLVAVASLCSVTETCALLLLLSLLYAP